MLLQSAAAHDQWERSCYCTMVLPTFGRSDHAATELRYPCSAGVTVLLQSGSAHVQQEQPYYCRVALPMFGKSDRAAAEWCYLCL